MCLSSVFDTSQEGSALVFSSVKDFTIEGNVITFTDILGDELSIQGTIDRVDFVESAIYITAS